MVGTYRGGLAAREAELTAVEAELATWALAQPLAATVARLGAYRGIAQLTGLTLAAEVVDWRRFATARAFMGFAGWFPASIPVGNAPAGVTSPRPARWACGPRCRQPATRCG